MSTFSNIPLADRVAEAKRLLPLPQLMERRGLGSHAKTEAFCPFHENTKTKAFSIFQDERGHWRWKCHSQCGHGDEITLLEKLDGLSNKEATRQYIASAGVASGSGPCLPVARAFAPLPRPPSPARVKPSLPSMEAGCDADLAQLASLRRVSLVSLLIARDVGLLRFATLRGHRAWIVTDEERVNAQARRLDGELWEHIGAKAWTLPGSWASHPIGLKLAEHYPSILLVEGGGDLLAALHFIEVQLDSVTWAVVAMLGASQRIPVDALRIFAGKRVRVFPHTDDAGKEAARKWARQLMEAGAVKVDAFTFTGLRKADGSPVGDLNDCTAIHPDDASELEGLLP